VKIQVTFSVTEGYWLLIKLHIFFVFYRCRRNDIHASAASSDCSMQDV